LIEHTRDLLIASDDHSRAYVLSTPDVVWSFIRRHRLRFPTTVAAMLKTLQHSQHSNHGCKIMIFLLGW